MENEDDIRWIQRFGNFNKAIQHLENALEISDPDIFQKAGIIHFFEMSVELAWKTVKDYLEAQGFIDVKSPRNAIKKAFEINLLQNGHIWMDLLKDRNLTSHTYDEKIVSEIEQLIRKKYFPILKTIKIDFSYKIDEK